MADLKTNYVDDVLDTTKNQLRKYQQIQNDDGTVSFVDVTEYTQVGTSFGAKDINDTNAAINDVNGKLVASDNTPFRFGVNKNGEYGYIVTDSEGADSVVPFKTDNLTLVAKNYSYQGAGTSCSYTCTKNCKIGVFGTAFSAGTNGSYGGSHVYVNGAEQSISRIAVESDATRGVFFTVINAKKGDVILVKAGINSGNNYLHSICIFSTE